MEIIYRLSEKDRIINFKRSISSKLYTKEIGIDEALVEMFTFYSRNNIDEPPFIVLKLMESAVNSPYEIKIKILERMGVM